MLLLSGDAIVNESMLTGESVPISKIPVKNEGIALWKDLTDVQGEISKSFIYGGTKLVRVRRALALDGGEDRPALALIVRTGRDTFYVNIPYERNPDMYVIGFNTTKGALVRSMLFPKPIGFKFYRDSIRFIGVLAGIAGVGFCASAIQFIRLGVRLLSTLFREASPKYKNLFDKIRSNGKPSFCVL